VTTTDDPTDQAAPWVAERSLLVPSVVEDVLTRNK
jgi:hypothetical protein